MQERVYDIIVEKDDIAWKSILLDLMKREEMNPWDIDIGKLTHMYIERIKQLRENDLKLSGKVLLAAAILLKIKSKRLVGEDLDEFDRLLASQQEDDTDLYVDSTEAFEGDDQSDAAEEEKPVLMPRTPLPRKRKVSVYDLVRALEKALEVKHRRLVKTSMPEVDLKFPEHHVDITLLMKRLFLRIREFFLFRKTKKLELDSVIATQNKEEKLREVLALLHLATSQKIMLKQKEPFGTIEVQLNPRAPPEDTQKTLVSP